MTQPQKSNQTTIAALFNKVRSLHLPLILNLILSHFVAAAVALLVFIELFAITTPISLTLALLAGTTAGLLLTLNLVFGIHLIEDGLLKLARGLPLKPISFRPWPLQRTLEYVNELAGHGGEVGKLRGTLHQQLEATTAQEIRNRLARDLHDSIKQQIFSMNVSAAAVEARWENDPEGALLALADVRRGAKEAMAEMNALLQQLRPAALEKVGLIEALREQCEALGYRTGADIRLDLGDLPPDNEWLPGTQEAVFRIAQEALANIARHARAKHVTLHLKAYEHANGRALLLVIEDDGRGFDPKQATIGMGLANIRQRVESIGGTLKIWARPEHGTTIRVEGIVLQGSKIESKPEAKEKQALTILDTGTSLIFIIFLNLIIAGFILTELPDIFSSNRSFTSQFFYISQLLIFIFLGFSAFRYYRRSIQTGVRLKIPSKLMNKITQRQKYLWAALLLLLLLLFIPIHVIYLSGKVGGSIPWFVPLLSMPILGLPALYAWFKALSFESEVIKQLSTDKKFSRIENTVQNIGFIFLALFMLIPVIDFDILEVGGTLDFSVAASLTVWPAIWIIIMTYSGMYLFWRWRVQWQNFQNHKTGNQ